MRVWVVLLLFLGFPLAEGTLSPSSESELWRQSGVDTNYVRRFVKNELCWQSPTWRQACSRAVVRGLRFVSFPTRFIRLTNEFNKEIQKEKPDFSAWIGLLEKEPTNHAKAMMWGYMANSVLTTFDAHARIQPFGMQRTIGSGAHDEIGLGFQAEVNGATVTVRRVFTPSPAAEAGIQVNDRILAVNGKNLGEGAQALIRLWGLNGAMNKEVALTLLRGGMASEKILRMQRIQNPDAVLKNTEIAGRRVSILTLYRFNSGVCKLTQEKIKQAQAFKPVGIVLDLRFNTGGVNGEALCVGKIFTDKSLAVHRYFSDSLLPEELDLRPAVFRDSKPGEEVLTPNVRALTDSLILLVNYSTASAAEMLAAGLQDAGRAWVVGEPTLGKGIFQLNESLHFSNNLQLRHTICEIIRPIGISLQHHGVTPNFIIPFESAEENSVRTFPREKDLFPYALPPTTEGLWAESRGDRHHELKKCVREGGLVEKITAELHRSNGYEDYQQAFAMAALLCEE